MHPIVNEDMANLRARTPGLWASVHKAIVFFAAGTARGFLTRELSPDFRAP
jgi:hypothetical protein